jgi:hypothetical protein
VDELEEMKLQTLLKATAVAVAVKVTSVLVPLIVAVTVFAPTEPNVRVDDVCPFVLVELDAEDKLPPPPVTAQFTVAPLTGFELESVTKTTNGLVSAEPRVAVCELPETIEMREAEPVVPVSVNVTEVLVPLIVAVAVLAPTAVPNVKVLLASPLESVLEVLVETEPPPEATDQLI